MSAFDPDAKPHNPLMLPDLFYNVLDCFHPDTDPVSRQALLALAQTCRAFSDPSLNRLWRKLYSLEPLIRCYTTIDQVENGIPPTPSQFDVIDRYSHRILELTISDHTSVRFLQCTSMRPSCLLPNLMVLRWSPYVRTPHIPIIFIQRLLGPALIDLSATLAEADEATLLSFFENYSLLCPHLKSIEFRFSSPLESESTMQALSRAICRHRVLERAILHTPIDEIALTYLCTIPMLRVFSVHLSEKSRLRTADLSPMETPLSSAEELEFTTSDLDLVTSLLDPPDQIFHTFRLRYNGRLTSATVVDFFRLLISQSPPNPLQELTLSVGDISHPVPADQMPSEAALYRLSYRTLQPLMVLDSLRVLTIEWSEQISLDDNELAKLARSWPMLQVFNIYCGRGGYPPFSTKYVTLQGLLSLVNACPALDTVSLPLDARHVPMVDETDEETSDSGPVARETEFACLIVPESPISEARPVVEFLRTYLPSVTAVDAKFQRPPGANVQQIIAYEQAWQQVDTQLDELYSGSCMSDTQQGEEGESFSESESEPEWGSEEELSNDDEMEI